LRPAEVAAQCVQEEDHRIARGAGTGTAGVARAVADYTLAGGRGQGGGTLASHHPRTLLLLEVADSEGGGFRNHRLSFGRPTRHKVKSSFVGG